MPSLTGGFRVVLFSPRPSSHSRPQRIRFHEKNSEKSSESVEDSAAENLTVEPSPENESLTAPPETAATAPNAPVEPEAIGSALKAWSGPETALTSTAAPRVREPGARPAQTPATKPKPTRPAQKTAAPPKRKPKPTAEQMQTEAVHQKHIEEHRETRILVIENDVEAADHVINILENDGYAVEIATDATYGAMLAQTLFAAPDSTGRALRTAHRRRFHALAAQHHRLR